MAKISLDIDDLREGNLPPVCLKCGGKASSKVEHTFTRRPTWMVVYNYLPLSSHYIALDQERGKVPLCVKHKKRLTLGRRLLLGFILTMISLVGVALVCMLAIGGQTGATLAFGALLFALPLLALIPPTILYADLATPRVVQIDSETVTLESVAGKFASRLVAESPSGLRTSPNIKSTQEGLPKVVFTIALLIVCGPIALGAGLWGQKALAEAKTADANTNDNGNPGRRNRQRNERESRPATDEGPDTNAENEAPASNREALDQESEPTDKNIDHNSDSVVRDPIMGTLLNQASEEPDNENDPGSSELSQTPSKPQGPLGNKREAFASVDQAFNRLENGKFSSTDQSLFQWLLDQELSDAESDRIVPLIWPATENAQLRYLAIQLLCKHAKKNKHEELLHQASEKRWSTPHEKEIMQLVFRKLRDWDDPKALQEMATLLNSQVSEMVQDEMRIWADRSIPYVLPLLHGNDRRSRVAALQVLDGLKIPDDLLLQQCTSDLKQNRPDLDAITRSLALISVTPQTRLELGRVVIEMMAERRVDIEKLLPIAKQCVCRQHVEDIRELLDKSKKGNVLDAGRELAVHLRDPELYPAVVALIDVPFGDRPTLEVCRKIGPGVQQHLWPYLRIPKFSLSVCEVLSEIGTAESIRPLTLLANNTQDRRLIESVATAVQTIRQQGRARAQKYRQEEKQRLEEVARVDAELGTEERDVTKAPSSTPAVNDSVQPAKSITREWTDVTGKFRRSGEYISKTETTVSIRMDGRIVELPIEKLSKEDQVFLQGLD